MKINLLAKLLLCALIIQGCKKIDNSPPPDDELLGHKGGNNNNHKGIDIKMVSQGLVSPIGLVAIPDHSKRLAVIDQIGKVWIIDANGNTLPMPFIDVSSKITPLNPNYDERGLLGLAFHPKYKYNGRFFIYYTLPPRPGGPQPGVNWNNLSRISEFRVSMNPNVADMGSEKVILEMDDPQSNHNGGTIAFGPDDDYLYIAIGDGGAANDVAPGHVEDWYPVNAGGNGQDITANLFGDILRIDVDRGSPYAIPRDNPFVNRPGRDEIYAYGFRNPFRFSFDMGANNQLYAGDAGQVLYEEISVVKKGGNYGWNVKEGTHCFNAANNKVPFPNCPDRDNLGNKLIDPVIELLNWQHPQAAMAKHRATTIIGGNVYRGNDIPGLHGKYIFGTFSQSPTTADGELFVTQPQGGNKLWSFKEIMLASHPSDVGYYLKGFGQDLEGEIYLTVSSLLGPTGNTGKIFKLVPVKDKHHGNDDED